MEEEKQKVETIFSADFSKHTKKELLHLLDDWIDDIKNLRQMRIGLRMLMRIIQSKDLK